MRLQWPISVRRIGLVLLLLGAAAACRTLEMTPKARRVSIATDATAVGACKLRGEVFALAPFRTTEEPVNQLNVRANGIGADTLVIVRDELGESAKKDWKAKAYRCNAAVPAETIAGGK